MYRLLTFSCALNLWPWSQGNDPDDTDWLFSFRNVIEVIDSWVMFPNLYKHLLMHGDMLNADWQKPTLSLHTHTVCLGFIWLYSVRHHFLCHSTLSLYFTLIMFYGFTLSTSLPLSCVVLLVLHFQLSSSLSYYQWSCWHTANKESTPTWCVCERESEMEEKLVFNGRPKGCWEKAGGTLSLKSCDPPVSP